MCPLPHVIWSKLIDFDLQSLLPTQQSNKRKNAIKTFFRSFEGRKSSSLPLDLRQRRVDDDGEKFWEFQNFKNSRRYCNISKDIDVISRSTSSTESASSTHEIKLVSPLSKKNIKLSNIRNNKHTKNEYLLYSKILLNPPHQSDLERIRMTKEEYKKSQFEEIPSTWNGEISHSFFVWLKSQKS